jgi:hypothetical protein
MSKIWELRGARGRRKVVVHADNVIPHVSQMIRQFMDTYRLRPASRSPYFPDRATCNFSLFGHAKRAIRRLVFKSMEKLLERITSTLATIQPKTLLVTIYELTDRLQTCIDEGRESIE